MNSASDIIDSIKKSSTADSNVDYIAIYESTDFINDIAPKILGIMVTILLIVVPIIICIELMYINFNIVQKGINDIIEKKGKYNILKLTLNDAIKAVTEANTIKTGKSANLLYLKYKLIWIVIIAFCITIACMGTGVVVNTVSKVIGKLVEDIKAVL